MVRSGLLGLLLLGLLVNNCHGLSAAPCKNSVGAVVPCALLERGLGHKPGQGNGTCEDKWPEDKCIKLMEADKCEKMGKMCKKTCDMCDDDESGEDGKCKDKMDSKKCKKILKADKCDKFADKCMKTCNFCDDDGSASESGESGEGGKCKDMMPYKKCMKTCNMCEEEPKKSPFELIDENGDGNITRG